MEIKINENNFEQEVLSSKIPVIADFWATWCGPCLRLSPVLEEIAKEFDGKIKVAKINVDEQVGLAIKYKVEVIPTLLLFKDGAILKKTVGYLDKNEVKALIKENFNI